MPAFLLSPLIRYGIIAIVIALLAGAFLIERSGKAAAVAERDAAKQALDLAQQDAKRWRDASDVRDSTINALHSTLDTQSAAIEQHRANEEKAAQALRDAERTNAELQATADQLSKELDDEASAHPESVVKLGPLVQQRVEGLWK